MWLCLILAAFLAPSPLVLIRSAFTIPLTHDDPTFAEQRHLLSDSTTNKIGVPQEEPKQRAEERGDFQTPYSTTSEARVEEVHEVLMVVVKHLENSLKNLKGRWFLTGGGLIGAKRCHPPGMNRWDDDVDLAVIASDLEAVHAVLQGDPQLRWKRHGQLLAYQYGLVDKEETTVEVFGLGLVDNQWHFMEANGENIEKNFASEYFKDEEINSIVPCKFWDLTLNCPVGAQAHLERTFGQDVMSKAWIHSHGDGELTSINMKGDGQNLNQHSAYFPAMTRKLMKTLAFV